MGFVTLLPTVWRTKLNISKVDRGDMDNQLSKVTGGLHVDIDLSTFHA